MRTLSLALVLAPAAALADNFPYVTKGPVISGVGETEAWVAWATAHHEGTGTECTIEENTPFIGNHNTDVPTLALTPASSAGASFHDATCSREHKVHLTGLAPATHYLFTLDKPFDHEGGPTAGGEFTTAVDDMDAQFEFVVYGDNRDSQFSTANRPDHQAVADGIVTREGSAAFLLHTGDLALNIPLASGDDRGYSEFFDVERGLLSTSPIFATIGNHETIDTTEFDALVNAPGFAGSPHPYWSSFDWGGVHVAVVDAFEGAPDAADLGAQAPGVSDAQVAWLDEDLAAAHAAGRALFVVSHQSPFSHPDPNETSGHGGSQPMQDKVLPLLLRYGVLALFAGHDHYYQRGHEGCLDYFVVGAGGAPMYEPDTTAAGVAVAVKTTSYLVVSVDGTQASAVAKSASGSILDTFTFTPADGQPCGVSPADGGTDGGTQDAGTDAGTQDAGADAGTQDAGTDAGADAGTQDAGADADSGGSDADASADTGTDAGTQDAGTQDADSGGSDADAASPDADGGAHTAVPSGCGCNSAGTSTFGFVALALALGRRRARGTR